MSNSVTPWTAACQTPLSSTVSWSLLKFMSTECYLTVSSSVTPFSFCLQSFPTSGSFPMSQFFSSGGQSIRASASARVLPMNIQGWFPLGLTGLISLLFKGLSRVFFSTTIRNHQFFGVEPSLMAQRVKNPPAVQETQETWVWFLGQEDPLEKEMATHSSILAWEIPWSGKPGKLQF